ncbi:hypothetical protein [Kitasatospora sp. NPDC087315]|uniref:hypothetical protein n=1 Tax=Kitasatospora sp. NPDC087315 TaxID=3364069 RepID=UPI00383063A3
MRTELTRDSVAMGDDVSAPHAERREFPDGIGVRDAVVSVLADGYLATVQGGRATWIVVAADRTRLAVVAQQWAAPRLLPAAGQGPLARFTDRDGVVRLHFDYRQQTNPEAEFERLSATGARADG